MGDRLRAIDQNQNITTLGRGGSDTTAVALAAALKAKECEIYTDVDGVYTTDPRIVAKAQKLDKITYEEMLEMASLDRFNSTHLAFLEQLCESIGIVINTIEANMRTEDLLKQSQSLAQELQARGEELE